MRKTIKLLLLIAIAIPLAAQVRTPRPSPKATLTQTVGLTDITINYSRPGVKGRPIWGGLVPYDKVWRTGANEATTITFSDDVTIGGQTLKKGTYSLHTTPGASQWTIHFNSVADQWGSYSYDPAKDVVKVTATPEKAEFREWLTFEIPEMTTDTAKVVIRWENVAVPFTVNTNSTAKTLSALKAAMAPSWLTPYQAASFAFDNKGAATDQEISDWLDQSLRVTQNTANLWLKARFLQRAGKTAEAKKTAEQAIAAATPQQADFASEIRRTIASW
jgi:Protein of unknown function (DUF2911)